MAPGMRLLLTGDIVDRRGIIIFRFLGNLLYKEEYYTFLYTNEMSGPLDVGEKVLFYVFPIVRYETYVLPLKLGF